MWVPFNKVEKGNNEGKLRREASAYLAHKSKEDFGLGCTGMPGLVSGPTLPHREAKECGLLAHSLGICE